MTFLGFSLSPVACGLALWGLCVSPLCFGQHLLLVKEWNKAPALVVNARGALPIVLRDGKEVLSNGNRFALVEDGTYRYAFVSVRNANAEYSAVSLHIPSAINKEIYFSCDLETAYDLDKVVMVLEAKTEDAEKILLVFEVGQLEAREVKSFVLRAPISVEIAPGNCELHLFSAGRELFSSETPGEVMDQALDKVVREKIKDVQTANAQPLLGPLPEYAKALRKKKVEGRALVEVNIDAAGHVSDPRVTEATHAEFGEAAMKVIRQWRFLPKVEAGKPVAAKVRFEMPFRLPKESK